MDKFYLALEQRLDKGVTPYNLRNCAYIEDFFEQKIIFQEMVQEPSFILDKDGKYMCLDTARIITGENLDILLAILNSKIFFYSIKVFYGGGGLGETGVRMKHTFFEDFPMPIFSKNSETDLKNLILTPNLINLRKIDEIIYNLYSLDSIEIAFIESQ